MKKIFDGLREEMQKRIDRCEANDTPDIEEGRRMFILGKQGGLEKAVELLDEAEAKWEADCCEWKLEDAEANLYVTSCGKGKLVFEDMCTPTEDDYKFCPYCGKKIKEDIKWNFIITL